MKLKTFYIVTLCVILLIFCLMMYSAFSNIAARASSDSISDKPCIIIDAGHGGEDGGAEVDGVLEKDINLSIADKVADMLRVCGCEVQEIRDEDVSVYDDDARTLREKKVSDLNKRVEVFNSDERNIVVSIHQNKFDSSAYSGTQLFYSTNDPDSMILAEAIRTSVVSLLQSDNTRELKPAGSNIYVLDHAQVPAVIVECGFLSNPDERRKLTEETYQREMAYSITMGVLDYIQAN